MKSGRTRDETAPLLADLPTPAVVAQPENRGTAPAILYALLVLSARQAAGDPVAFIPSDHFVSDGARFMGHSVDFSRQVLTARPGCLAVLPVRGVHWSDLGDPERVRATWRRTRTTPMTEMMPMTVSA